MFQINTPSPEILVRVDSTTGRPREIRAAGRRLAVTDLEAFRDETAAYPLQWGPRTVYVLRADGRRYRLVHLIRDQRWTLEELDARSKEIRDLERKGNS